MPSEAQSARKLGYEEYARIPDDGQRHEIIDGRHVVNPAPNTYHQTVSRRIHFQLYQQIELEGLGQVYNAPTDLQLSDTDIVQPDLIVVLQPKLGIIEFTHIRGIPDLVVEIISPSLARHDRQAKKERYQATGIPEYWIVDPDKRVVDQFVLRDREYNLVGHHSRSVTVDFNSAITVDLQQVWTGPVST